LWLGPWMVGGHGVGRRLTTPWAAGRRSAYTPWAAGFPERRRLRHTRWAAGRGYPQALRHAVGRRSQVQYGRCWDQGQQGGTCAVARIRSASTVTWAGDSTSIGQHVLGEISQYSSGLHGWSPSDQFDQPGSSQGAAGLRRCRSPRRRRRVARCRAGRGARSRSRRTWQPPGRRPWRCGRGGPDVRVGSIL
jgi:hypothetical protein